jgi:hypothetical protein
MTGTPFLLKAGETIYRLVSPIADRHRSEDQASCQPKARFFALISAVLARADIRLEYLALQIHNSN